MFNVVLVEPEIPANTGNIGRTCVLTGSRLHLVGELGFSLESRMLKRAGLGYWENLDVRCYPSWEDFLKRNNLSLGVDAHPRVHLLTKKARKTYVEASYHEDDYLVFGKESIGLSEGLLAAHSDLCERIPMLKDEQSLANRSEWHARREEVTTDAPDEGDPSPLMRQDICGNFIDPHAWEISALNLSNAVAVVLYEALRQTDFWANDG